MGDTEERRLNLKQILITALITGIVGVVTGMLLFYFQRQEPLLTYEVKESLPFIGDQEKLAIHYVSLRNGGKKVVTDVDCHISVAPAIIKEVRVAVDASLKHTERTTGGEYEVHFPNLNPNEEATISILASTSSSVATNPLVSLRGQGVTGIETPEKDRKNSLLEGPMLPALVSAYSVLGALFIMIRIRRRRIPSSLARIVGM